MKKINIFLWKSLLIFVTGIFLLGACDKIEEPFTRQSGFIDTVTGVQKRVLLEDYTGHTCVNCPKAAKIAHDLKATYGDRLIIMAIHAGGYAIATSSGDFTYDFRTASGTEWDGFFGISNVGNPNGMVDRKNYPNDHILSPSGWAGAVSTALSETPLVDLGVVSQYNSTTRNLSVTVTTTFLSATDKNLKLVVALTESGIIKPQRNNDNTIGAVPIIFDYQHNHVLRGTLSTTWGSAVADPGTAYPSSVGNDFGSVLNSGYVPENCSVVAFVYDDDTKEVLQAVEAEML